MTERGRYHGQRLGAREVLQYYALGERDFRGAVLSGDNFCNADLSGANFSETDIRSTRFVNATLRGVKLCHAYGGLQWWWWWCQLALVGMIAALSGLLQGYAGALIGVLLVHSQLINVAAGIAGIVFVAVVFRAIAYQGFKLKTLGSFAIAAAVAVTFAAAGAIGDAIVVVVVVGGAVAGSAAVAATGAITGAGVVAGGFTFVGAIAGASTLRGADASTFVFAFMFAGASFLLAVYINRRIESGDPKFENLRLMGLTIAALGGTTFSGADLTKANFAHTCLKNTSFADSQQRPTISTHARWHQAQKLDHARLGTSNLQDPRVRALLITLNGIDQNFSNADLCGVNLAGAQLHRINFRGANLNGAMLQGAELQGAKLTETQCIGTDFTATQLTGACLEAWHIDRTTILKDIDCRYVYLLEQPDARGDYERRPHNPDKDFQSGDFEKFFKDTLDTVQILIRNGVNPESFKAALQSLVDIHPNFSADAIRGFERKGEDVLVTLEVPEGVDKGKIERLWDEVYEARLQAATTRAELEAERHRSQDIKEVALGFSKVLSSLEIHTVNKSIKTGDGSVYAGGDLSLTGSTLNLGEISGQVRNQINQLPSIAPSEGQPSLKDLLSRLKNAIEQDTELSEIEKKEALGEVIKLAEAGRKREEWSMQRMAKRATDALNSITEPHSEVSTLANTCRSLLPKIMALF